MRKITTFFSVVFLLLIAAMHPTYAEKGIPALRVGYYENGAFQSGAEPGAIRQGSAYEYYRKISEYTGWQYEYVYGGFTDLYQMLLNGEIDLLAGLAKTESRIGVIGYPEFPMGSETYNMVKHSEDDRITTSYDTLNGMRIGALDSAIVQVLRKFLDEHGIAAEIAVFPDHQSLLDAFKWHRVDAMVSESDGSSDQEDTTLASVYGEGSTFSFAVEQRVVDWTPIGDFEQAYRRSISKEHAYHECFIAPDAHVLVVDDTKMNLTVMRGLLKETKIHLDEAESGQECLALTGKTKYDVILLDHRMPGMDGVETLAALRAQTDGKNGETPVICLTANAISGAREWYLEQGFNDYLTKPVSSKQLEAILLKYLPPELVSMTCACHHHDDDQEELPDWLSGIQHLDTAMGLQNCGSAKDYLEALRIFRESVAENAAAIEGFLGAKDWQNYTTKVHALKSSARIIGASELSERAARLEDAGNRRYIEEIEKDTPTLLALYRACGETLAPLDAHEEKEQEDLPEIDEASLAEAYEAIKEMAASFDYDSIQLILEELAGSRVPKEKAERHARLTAAAKKPDWDALKKILEES